jgi:hypothetical protein
MLMSPTPIGALAAVLLAITALPACSEQPRDPDAILDDQLDNLESRVNQRQRREQRTRDLLTDQDLGVSERRLNTLKTREPRNGRIPLLERQYDRIRRPLSPGLDGRR